MKDIEENVKICSKVLTLNIHKSNANKEQNEKNWMLKKQAVKNEAMKILLLSQDPSQDKFMLIGKLLNMKENLVK